MCTRIRKKSKSSHGGETTESSLWTSKYQDSETTAASTIGSGKAKKKFLNSVPVDPVVDNLALPQAVVAAGLLVMVIIMFALVHAKISALDSSTDKPEALQTFSSELLGNFSARIDKLKRRIRFNSTQLTTIFKFSSCAKIYRHNPSSSSGYYTVRSRTGHLISVYCDMAVDVLLEDGCEWPN